MKLSSESPVSTSSGDDETAQIFTYLTLPEFSVEAHMKNNKLNI
jgi:hypothetical protein